MASIVTGLVVVGADVHALDAKSLVYRQKFGRRIILALLLRRDVLCLLEDVRCHEFGKADATRPFELVLARQIERPVGAACFQKPSSGGTT